MSNNTFVIGVCISSLIVGILFGKMLFKIISHRKEKKLIKNAIEVISGQRENKIIIDGQKYDATKFIIRDENGNKTLIDLKGGEEKEYGKTKEIESRKKEDIDDKEEIIRDTREDSISNGEEKRNIGNGSNTIRKLFRRRYG